MADPPFKEVEKERDVEGEAVADLDLLEYYSRLNKEDRSHEQFEELVDMVRLLWHHKNYLEREIHYLRRDRVEAEEANGTMLTIMKHLCDGYVRDGNGGRKRVNELATEFNKDYSTIVTDIVLNDEKMSMTRRHFRQIMHWYCHNPSMFFEAGDELTYSNGSGVRPYKFTLGEIVSRRYKSDSGEWDFEEVIVFGEKGYIVDILTMAELRRADSRSAFLRTKFVWLDDVESFNPKRFFMSKERLFELYNEMYPTIE